MWIHNPAEQLLVKSQIRHHCSCLQWTPMINNGKVKDIKGSRNGTMTHRKNHRDCPSTANIVSNALIPGGGGFKDPGQLKVA